MAKKRTAKPPPAPIMMGIREYARHREERGLAGATHRAVQVAIRDGRLVRAVRGGKIDAAIADAEWASTTLSQRIPHTGPTSVEIGDDDDDLPPGVPSLKESRARREAAEAALAEIELAEKRGDLVLARDVESKLVNVFAHCKTKLLGVAARARQADPGLADSQVELFASLIRDALEDLAGKKAAG
jgi:phage terminase Nu1 subunit (DNA packaging protein)